MDNSNNQKPDPNLASTLTPNLPPRPQPKWKRHIPLVLDILHQVSLTIWLGGLLVLWLALMPATFHDAELTVRQGEMVVGATLQRFLGIAEISGLLMIAVQFLLRRRYKGSRATFIMDGVRQLCTFGALLIAELALRGLLPQMDLARQQVRLAEFHQLHQGYAILATIQTIALLVVSILTIFLSRQLTPTSGPSPEGEGRMNSK